MLGYEYLVDIAKDSISDLPKFKDMDFQEVPKDTGFSDLISIHVGIEKDSEKSLDINFNKIDEHANNYVGIVGKPGSGKTYFSKYFLEQLRKKTNYQTNFIIFDYAKGDIANDENFIKETNAEVINVKRQPIPLNPFYLVENSEQEQKYAAERIVEIFVNVEAHLGNVQEQNLYNAIMQAYEDRTYQNPPYPDFYEVFQQLELINDKPDTLTSIFRPLTEHNIFARSGEKIWHSLHDRTAIIDIHELPALKDLCVFFVLKEIYDKIMVMPDSDVEEDMKTRKMRTVIVLDEAHHFLENRKRVKVLAKMIREIRSKGASVMLLSQSPDDYKNADFNFLEMLEFVFVLQCSPSSHNFLQQVFRIDSSKAKKLITDVANMSPHRAITLNNSNEVREVLLCR
jgi:type IV secretory pathway VirB4 component